MQWKTSTGKKKIISLVAAVSLVGGGFYWFAGAAQKPREDRFRPVPVTQSTIEEVITAQGKLEPKEYVDVGSQVSGQLKQIHVEIGAENFEVETVQTSNAIGARPPFSGRSA